MCTKISQLIILRTIPAQNKNQKSWGKNAVFYFEVGGTGRYYGAVRLTLKRIKLRSCDFGNNVPSSI